MPQEFSRRTLLAASLAGLAAPAFAQDAPLTRNTDKVRLGWSYYGLNLIAKERGVFDKILADQGLKVEWIGPFPNHAPSLQAVAGGSADFSFGGSTTPAFAAMLSGAPLVFSQFARYEPRTTAIIARDGSRVDKVEDLVGKSVAVNRSGLGEFLLVAALELHGVDRSKVNFVYLNPPEAGPAFASGKVDAWSMWSPGVDIARSDNHAHDVFLESRDLPFWIDYSSFVTTADFVKNNAAIVQAVNAGLKQEADWINTHPAEAEAIAQKKIGYPDAVRDHFIAERRHWTLFPPTDQKFVAELQQAADWLSKRKILPENIVVADHLGIV